MSPRTILIPFLLAVELSACDTQPTEVGPGASRADRSVGKADMSVKLPPSIAASRQYRCTDNSLVFVDYYSDDLSASIRTAKDAPAARIATSEPGKELSGEGFSLKGGKADRNVTVTTPDHPDPLSCHL